MHNGYFRIESFAMDMNAKLGVTHLRALVAVAKWESFTAAGQELGLSQSSLSRQVAEVERLSSVTIFRRTTRKVEVTRTGEEIVAEAQETLLAFDEGLHEMSRLASGESGVVSIACLPSIAASYLPAHLRNFGRSHPDVAVEIRDGLLHQVLQAVRTGAVDFGIAAQSSHVPGLVQQPLTSDKFLCAMYEGHPLALRETITWNDLHDEHLIAFSPESSINAPVEGALNNAGVVLKSVTKANNVGAVAGLVAAGIGITVIPGLVRTLMEFAHLTFVPLEPTVQRNICITLRRRERLSPAAKDFVHHMTQGVVPS